MTDYKSQKADIRAKTLDKRDGLTIEMRMQTAQIIADAAPQITVTPNMVISGFWPIRSEIDPRPLMMALRAKGAQLCLPAVIDRQTIVFRRFDDETTLKPAGFGTHAPGPEAEVMNPDLMLVPLSAYDDYGNRIGYGAGHYDRAIARLIEKSRKPVLIGLAFSCQKVAAVPFEPHDVPLDAIVTEHGLLWCGLPSNPV